MSPAHALPLRRCTPGCRPHCAGEAPADSAGAGPGEAPGAGPPAGEPVNWEGPPGRLLGGVIEGCIWSLLVLQQGCEGGAPAGALAGALDTALTAVRPHAAANQQLYADIRQAMDALRTQLLFAAT